MRKIYQKMYLTNKSRSKGVLGGFIHNVVLRSFYPESHLLFFKRAGFTLIELLVVVLIIGILAAVAVPQYQKVVLKSRFMSFMPTMRAIKDAQERYYMANGNYALDVNSLDISIPGGCQILSGSRISNQIQCGTDWLLDNLGNGDSSNPQSESTLILYYCPGDNGAGTASCANSANLQARIHWYYDWHPTKGGQITCDRDDSSQLCSTLMGAF